MTGLDDLELVTLDDAAAFARCPIEWERSTEPQEEWRRRTERFLVWRGANSIGKSRCQAADMIDTARGTNRYRPTPHPAVDLLVLGYSYAQMDPLCRKLWDLVPKDEIPPCLYYQPNNGIRGLKEPCIPFVSGPGAGSLIRLATYEQGPQRYMGWQGHGAYLDEPPDSTVYGEVIPRLNANHGFLRISFTPTPESPDLEYMRELVQLGKDSSGRRGLVEQQTSISVGALTVRGALVERPWMSAGQIAEALDRYLEEERDMREHGAWTIVRKGRWINTYTDETHLSTERPPKGAWLVVGIDHGIQAGKQTAVLAAYTDRDRDDARMWVLDEACSDGTTTVEQDAANILEMLTRNGLKYQHVDQWIADRSASDPKQIVRKDNARLRNALAKALKEKAENMLDIPTPYKYAGSVRHGCRLLRDAFGRRTLDGKPLAVVHPRCVRVRAGLLGFAGDPRDPVKDALDSLLYNSQVALGQAPWSPIRGVL